MSIKDEGILWTVVFGSDQQKIIDHLLNAMKEEGRVISYQKHFENSEYMRYEIILKTAFDAYTLGFRQARLTQSEIWQIILD